MSLNYFQNKWKELINKEQFVQIILRPTYNFTKQENSRDFGLAKRHRKCTVESEHRISFLEEQKDPPAMS